MNEKQRLFTIGALIGRIGAQIFGVGKSVVIVTERSGTLWLRINDGDVGLKDNEGELIIEIQK